MEKLSGLFITVYIENTKPFMNSNFYFLIFQYVSFVYENVYTVDRYNKPRWSLRRLKFNYRIETIHTKTLIEHFISHGNYEKKSIINSWRHKITVNRVSNSSLALHFFSLENHFRSHNLLVAHPFLYREK